jgi:glycosyltransferase involved in cell wall biosynthesis
MRRVAVLTDFCNFDPAYSLCRVVQAQVKMLANGHEPRLLVREGFQKKHEADYPGAEFVALDPGETGQNRVVPSDRTADEIDALTEQMRAALRGIGVVLTHDLIYQPNLFKHHVAARRLAGERGDLRWLHWVHSATDMKTAQKTGRFRKETAGKFPNAKLVAMHPEEVNRKGALHGYERDEIVIIPNPIDFAAEMHPLAREVIARGDLMRADIIACYPCRLDRGKQPHVLIEVFAELAKTGRSVRVVIVDFHSTGGDKADYREEMRRQAEAARVPLVFTSDAEGGWGGAPYSYCVPHEAVMDLFEVADVLVHPSMSESDPLILPEAAWKRCGLVLNYDLPVFRQHDGQALQYKFSSNIDVYTGLPGETRTEYADRAAYMRHVAAGIAYWTEQNPVLALHAKMRKERSLEGVWPKLEAAIEGQW